MAGNITRKTEFFIESIEKRPALYVKSLKEFSDMNYKKRLWDEVCSEVVTNWTELDAEDRKEVCADVQKKWFNLRTCFARELKAQKNKTGLSDKHRKYIYYNNLLFLKSSVAPRSSFSVLASSDLEEDSNCMVSNEEPVLLQPLEPPTKKYKPANANLQDSLLHMFQEDIDEDKTFALSLVPTLRSLTEDEKFDAKIEILQVFRRIKGNRIASYQEHFS